MQTPLYQMQNRHQTLRRENNGPPHHDLIDPGNKKGHESSNATLISANQSSHYRYFGYSWFAMVMSIILITKNITIVI